MIEWRDVLITISLTLPEILAALAGIGLALRRRWPDRAVLLWLLVPTAVLGFSAAVRFLPIVFRPAREAVESIGGPQDGLTVVWCGDMILRLLAWAGLLYGLFWKLPEAGRLPSPLDERSRQTAAMAALLALMLSEGREGEAPAEPRRDL